MSCIRTGFHAYCAAYDCWLYGDAFADDSVFWFRICQVSERPQMGVKHFTINDWLNWFDEPGDQRHNSTMICRAEHLESHDYDGVPVTGEPTK